MKNKYKVKKYREETTKRGDLLITFEDEFSIGKTCLLVDSGGRASMISPISLDLGQVQMPNVDLAHQAIKKACAFFQNAHTLMLNNLDED
jgi:hypothetical protein